MTKEAFHALLVDPQTGPRLTAMLADNAAVDAALAAEADRVQRAHNDEVVTRAIRTWFQKTEPK